MTFQVTGKNVELGEAYKTYVRDKISLVLEKYIGPEISGHIRLEKERSNFHTQLSIKLRTGLIVEANGEGGDAYGSADQAVERLEKRVRRYKRRLKSHHNGRQNGATAAFAAPDYTVRADDEGHEEAGTDLAHPVIVAESERELKVLPVSEAVMQLDLTEATFLVFRNAGHGGLNVVYRRADGHIGWIDPPAAAKPASQVAPHAEG
jgi:ribosomal subunit interface protein